MSKGIIFYIVGSSGVGKDSIINQIKTKLNFDNKFVFAKRFITRPNVDGTEIHIPLSKESFVNRLDKKLFALHWEAHDNFYGIGIELEYWIENGYNVIVNGSRGYLDIAKIKYPKIKAILIDAEKSIIYERLIGRSRESKQLIEQRMERNNKFNNMNFDLVIKNESTIEIAVDSLLFYINKTIAI